MIMINISALEPEKMRQLIISLALASMLFSMHFFYLGEYCFREIWAWELCPSDRGQGKMFWLTE
jgi:hypothetical protein